MRLGRFVGEVEPEIQEVVDSLTMSLAVVNFAIVGQVYGPKKADGSAVDAAVGKCLGQGWKLAAEVVDD